MHADGSYIHMGTARCVERRDHSLSFPTFKIYAVSGIYNTVTLDFMLTTFRMFCVFAYYLIACKHTTVFCSYST